MILVTGATGTVGTQLVRTLVQQGAPVRIGVHRQQPATAGAPCVPLDFDSAQTLAPALAGVDTVYLLSQAVIHERALVSAARAAGVRRIVKHSAWRAGDEAFTFGRRHRAVEREIEASGLEWTFLRPNSYMQNVLTSWGEAIRRDGAIYDSVGAARISHIDARDIAAVAARVLTEEGHAGKAYDLSGPRALGHEELAALLSRALGRPIRYVPVSDEEVGQTARAAGWPPQEADALVDLNRYFRSGACAAVSDAVSALLGRWPLDFEQFAREHAAALAAQGTAAAEAASTQLSAPAA